ncbi:MAG: hypothetical protein ABW210_05910 [Achromobacter sp.]
MPELGEEDVRSAYRAVLGRDADDTGLASYLAEARRGLTKERLIDLLESSPEFARNRAIAASQSLGEVDIPQLATALMPHILAALAIEKPWRHSVFSPSFEVYAAPSNSKFMPYSTCSGADFLHPKFATILKSIGLGNEMHRKLWEWVFIIHHLTSRGIVKPGASGLVFGVGKELLPSLFASLGARITATDAPIEIGVGSGWQSSNEHADGLAQMPEGKLSRVEFENMVEWRECDMNAIDSSLKDYDFCWSSCCFEHLGSLRHGMDFVINSVEQTLKPGGIAVHTTEFNLQSNDATVTEGDTVLYRKRDIEQLIAELETRGHSVEPFAIAPDSLVIDGYVDLPPYRGPHLKLAVEGYACTSVGLVITRRLNP